MVYTGAMASQPSYRILLNSLITFILQFAESFILIPASSMVNLVLFVTQDSFYFQTVSTPARRTNTQHLTIFTRPSPAAVSYDVSQPHSVTVTVPPQSTWTTGPHWHETHTEYLQVLEGLARAMVNGKTRVYSHSDGVIEVPKFTLHEWQREAKGYARANGEERKDLVVREWTTPADGHKETFFRMLNSYLIEPEAQRLHGQLRLPPFIVAWIEQRVILLQLRVIFRALDNWPAMDDEAECVDWLTWVVTHAHLYFAGVIGKLLGLEARYEEYVGADPGGRSSSYK